MKNIFVVSVSSKVKGQTHIVPVSYWTNKGAANEEFQRRVMVEENKTIYLCVSRVNAAWPEYDVLSVQDSEGGKKSGAK